VEDLIMKIAPGIYRIGGNSMINAYLIEQAGEVTIIDAGVCSVPPRGRGSSWRHPLSTLCARDSG
jgi:hypothetical protein